MIWQKVLAIGLLGCGVALVACETEGLLDVEDPDVALPAALKDTANLTAVRGLGVGDFGVAYGGASSTEGLVAITGIMSDELFHSGTFLPNRELDRRDISITNTGVTTVFRALHRARRSTELAAETFKSARGNSVEGSELLNLNAYIYLFFAEDWCSGVPVSRDADGVFTFEAPMSTADLLTEALNRFDVAQQMATAVNSATQQTLAKIGKARALLNQDKFAEAAAMVAGIQTTYKYQLLYSDNTTRQNNGIFGITQTRREYGIASTEGTNGQPFRTTPADSRVPWTKDAGAADAGIRQYTPRKYDARTAPIDLASGIEARLIEAEAALNKGASAAYLPILTALRTPIGLAQLTDPGSASGRVDQLFRERAFWLFAQAQRMSDMRRLVRQYGRTQAQVFPTGNYVLEEIAGTLRQFPSPFGSDVNFLVPNDELNNPEFKQCVDRKA